MPMRAATPHILVAFLLFLGVGSGFAQCPDTTITVTLDNPPVQGSGTLTISDGRVFLDIELTEPCEMSIHAEGIVTADRIQIGSGVVSLLGECEGSSFDLTLNNPCGDGLSFDGLALIAGSGGGTDPTPEPTPEPTPNPQGDDDDDDDENELADRMKNRSPLGGTRPEARLIDIDVEVNPSVIKLDDNGARDRLDRLGNEVVDDVTFTARLVFSGGVIPEQFRHHTSGWEFWPVREGEDAANQEKWSDAMRENTNLGLSRIWVPGLELNDENEQEDSHNKLDVNVTFTVLPGSVEGQSSTGRVQTKKVPVKVVYTTPDGIEFAKVVNVQVERKPSSGAFAGSSGPASRIVTYSRVLE